MELSRISKLLSLQHEVKPNKVHSNHTASNDSNKFHLTFPDELLKNINSHKASSLKPLNMISFENSTGDLNKPLINSDSKVLHIGDSHTVGTYGKEMDKLMRSTGAKVTTVGSAGSSPSWWFNGTQTHSGFYMKDEDGNVDSPADWKTPHVTPKIHDLISEHKPNIIIISLGANLIKASGEQIESQVKKIAEEAKASGAKIIWVGPPNGRSDVKPKEKQDFLYEHLKNVAEQYGTFVDSRTCTYYPDDMKGDGVHFGGTKGKEIATNWANTVFDEIQKSNK